jgi:hypothetical protein
MGEAAAEDLRALAGGLAGGGATSGRAFAATGVSDPAFADHEGSFVK